MSTDISANLKPVLVTVVNSTGMIPADAALEVATHHLAVTVSAMALSRKMNRGQARALARKQGEQVIELVTALWDQKAAGK